MKDNKTLSPLDKALWAVIGLLLTISGVFIEVAIPVPPLAWPIDWSHVPTYSLGVTLQIGAILLVGCMAGRNAAALSQIAYLILGLSGFQIFAQGGGLGYLKEPTFGYLLGFLPGAWICGHIAFRQYRRLDNLIMSCLWGLGAIHVVGLVYLTVLSIFRISSANWWEAVLRYSIIPLPGQFIIVCTVAAVAYLMRILLFY
ncbi:MAG: biotin transporter BioY [Acaryochloridaceae cyanobacterium RU_4_10]|jgi:biotin transport system substrate-specific component|nr:biotin transporter BioY [Acaryochloridaceae cyanobacterium RU_4_10]